MGNPLTSQFPLHMSYAAGVLIMLIVKMLFVKRPCYADKAFGVRVSLYPPLDCGTGYSEFSQV